MIDLRNKPPDHSRQESRTEATGLVFLFGMRKPDDRGGRGGGGRGGGGTKGIASRKRRKIGDEINRNWDGFQIAFPP